MKRPIIKVINDNDICINKLNFVIDRLSIDDKNKYSKVINKKGFLIARYLLLQNNIDISKIFYNKNGKPLLSDKYIGISHSAGYTLVVISDYEIGIDFEKIRNVDSSLKQYFCGNDISDIDFLHLFTKQEAYIKYNGLALVNIKDNIDEYMFIEYEIPNFVCYYCVGKK